MRFLHDSMAPAPTFPTLAALALPITVSTVLTAAGCDGCHGSKPYTPYTLSDHPSAAPAASSPVDAGAPAPIAANAAIPVNAGDAGPSFQAVPGTAPPGDGKSWPLDGDAIVNAPVGRTFSVGLALDIDGDGKRDLITFARAPDGLRGELLFAPGSKPDALKTIAAIPDGLSAPGCSARAELTQVGPRAVLFDFEPRCSARARDKATRWIALLRLPAAADSIPEIGMELRFGAPAEGESIQLAVDTRDRDGDGRADITATVTLTGAPHPFPGGASAAATLAFFDRPAGLSRDPTEPEASLKAESASLVADARRKTTAPRIADAARSLRRLYSLLCEEAGKPLITTTAGPVHCGEIHIAEDSTIAETEAALNLGEPIAAMAGMARLEALGIHRKDVDALLAKNIPSLTATALQKTTASPQIEPSPAYSPLAFDSSGDLLVHTADKVIRVDHTAFSESPIDAALRWPTKLASSADDPAWKLSSVEQRCDEPTLLAHFEAKAAAIDLPLPVATPPRCTPTSRVTTELLGNTAQGALLAVGADLITIPRSDPPKPALPESLSQSGAVDLGAARSPDGATLAIPTVRGLLVATLKGSARGASAKLWTGIDPGAAYLCVPANGGARVACVTRPNATIFEAK